jgi:NAD(P)-dependent dehydrogenase (short-subunit alcohol dehydrogenase family)
MQQPPFRLDGKTAVVTGGGSGIGEAIAQLFARAGASVRILDVNREAGERTEQRITAAGGDAKAHECDVTNHATVAKAFEHLVGAGPIHILINNAGISQIANLEKTSEADFDRIFNVNVKGFYNCMHAAVPHMKTNGGGVIVNMASIAATSGLADRFAYSMSKGAVVAMTYSVAKDYIAHNIRCNCISPARVHTPFVDDFLRRSYPGKEKEMYDKLAASAPINRMARPEEVASLALFLCSDEASFITGVDYPIDGGFFNLRG